MGNKTSATANRLPLRRNWQSNWFSKGSNYIDCLHEDLEIEKTIRKALKASMIDSITISRMESKVTVEVKVGKPGIAIGRGGSGLENLKKDFDKKYKKTFDIKIMEVHKADLSAQIVAQTIGEGVVKRMPLKQLMQNSMNKAMAAGAKGFMVWISGRLNGSNQARTVRLAQGRVPLHTLSADVEYAEYPAYSKEWGYFGIKVWICKDSKR